jgi:hypothetical protein
MKVMVLGLVLPTTMRNMLVMVTPPICQWRNAG